MRPGYGGEVLDRSWLRPCPTPAQVRTDLWVGVAAALVSVVNVEVYRSGFGADLGWHDIEAYVWFGVAGLVLAARRAMPLAVLAVEALLFIVIGERLDVLGATFPIQMVLFASLYAAWAWSRRTHALVAVTSLVIVAMFAWLLIVLLQPGMLPQADQGGLVAPAVAALTYSLVVNVVYFAGAVAWGHVAYRGARQRAVAEQGAALERALADQREQQAIGDERVRIARDLHDVVAHHVSSIGIQATGAERALEADPEAARAALGTIGSSSREAVQQMHQLVHLLRDGSSRSDRAPQPGLAALALLATDEGVPVVEHRVVGTTFAVPETTGLSLYRIGQEAMANVRRHSSARHASVVLRYLEDPRAVELEVVDDGRSRRSPSTSASGGFGLTGIRERATLHGGETEIGPRPQGGFRVRVRIPVRPS